MNQANTGLCLGLTLFSIGILTGAIAQRMDKPLGDNPAAIASLSLIFIGMIMACACGLKGQSRAELEREYRALSTPTGRGAATAAQPVIASLRSPTAQRTANSKTTHLVEMV